MLALPWWHRRCEGYRQACRELGLTPLLPIEEDVSLHTEMTPQGFLQRARLTAGCLAEALTSQTPPDALLAASDGACFYLAAACRLLHLVPGQDIAIVGYDNYWQDAQEREFVADVPVATVDKHNERIGAAMVELLLECAQGQFPPQPQIRVVEPKLVETRPDFFGPSQPQDS